LIFTDVQSHLSFTRSKDRKKQRVARFGTAIDPDSEERKAARAARFGKVGGFE